MCQNLGSTESFFDIQGKKIFNLIALGNKTMRFDFFFCKDSKI
jgi:hypothetical protein